jgi:hypothetical protein
VDRHDWLSPVGSPEQPEHLLCGQTARHRQIQVGRGRGVNGISGRGDAIADRVHGEAEVGTEIIVALDGPTTPRLGSG